MRASIAFLLSVLGSIVVSSTGNRHHGVSGVTSGAGRNAKSRRYVTSSSSTSKRLSRSMTSGNWTVSNVGRIGRWSEAAYEYVQGLKCDEVFFTSETECRRLLLTDRADMNVYAAVPDAVPDAAKLVAVLPDGALSRGGAHEAVLTLDPYPMASFGHLVLVFFVDAARTALQCRQHGGIFLDDSFSCMTLALKSRCLNLLDRKTRGNHFSRRCEINFLPLVNSAGSPHNQANQKLQCYGIPGFAECPLLRPRNETTSLFCNPLDVNTHRCLTTHQTVHTRCRLYESCDQAVLLAGGWNREHGWTRTRDNLHAIYRTLRDNGYHRNNVKVFYANGAPANQLVGEDTNSVYPSALKLALRYHLHKVCQSALCADTLFIYLNSITVNDGTMLLWDIDGNGEMESQETYTVRELMGDLRDCEARQIYLLVDQSYAGEFVKAFGQSTRHSRVIVIGSGREDEYSWGRDFNRHWNAAGHLRSCVTQVHEESHQVVRQSKPMIHDGSEGTLRTTLAGAPCDVSPPFTIAELQQNYLGCQNIPTKIWINRYMTSTTVD